MNEKKLNQLLKAISEETGMSFCEAVCPIGKETCQTFDTTTCEKTLRAWLNDEEPSHCVKCSAFDFIRESTDFEENGDTILRKLGGHCRKCGREYYIKEYFVLNRIEEEDGDA